MLPTGEEAFFSNLHKSIWANHGPTYSYFIPMPSSSLGSFYSSLSHYSFFTPHFSSWVQSYSLLSSYNNSQNVNIERELTQQLRLSISWCLWPQQSCSSLHVSYPLNSCTIDPVISRNFYFEILFFDLHSPLLQLTCCSGAPTPTFLVPFNDH